VHRLTRKKIPAAEFQTLRREVEQTFLGVLPRTEQSCVFSYHRPSPLLTLKLYTSGTFYVEATMEADIERARELVDGEEASAPTIAASTSERWVGSDECGKGDYFGPLVVVAVAVDRSLAARIDRMHVRDSKTITDITIHSLALQLTALLGDRAEIIVLHPAAYNESMDRQPYKSNAASLLGELHARAINALVSRHPLDEIVVDKFGKKEHVRSTLSPIAQQLRFTMVPKAESDPAVAAASVLARDSFVNALHRLSDQYGVALPKGASVEVEQAAREIVRERGENILWHLAKLHFRTTQRVV
jgi:ribonuclease HIII